MSFVQARRRIAEQAEQQQQHSPQKCAAIGCQCRATVNMAGSGYLCRYHVAAPADKWPRITDAIAQNDWLLALISDVQKMARDCKPWREFAVRFWDADPAGAPAPFEEASAYLYRMEQEMLFRCGQHPHRPEPRNPKELAKAFRAKHRKQLEAA